MLELRKVSWCQPRGALVAGVDLVIRPGEWVTLMGPNGAGKSTLLQIASGVLGFDRRSFAGEILWNGRDWRQFTPAQRASQVAYLGSDLDSVFPVTVSEVLGSGVIASGDCTRIEGAARVFDLGPFMGRELNTLSGGERQRVLLARAWVQGARMLFLDETLSKMDLDYQVTLGDRLKSLTGEGYSVVLVSHDSHLSVRHADRILLMQSGRLLADGKPGDVLTESLLSQVYPRASVGGIFSGNQK